MPLAVNFLRSKRAPIIVSLGGSWSSPYLGVEQSVATLAGLAGSYFPIIIISPQPNHSIFLRLSINDDLMVNQS